MAAVAHSELSALVTVPWVPDPLQQALSSHSSAGAKSKEQILGFTARAVKCFSLVVVKGERGPRWIQGK